MVLGGLGIGVREERERGREGERGREVRWF